MLGFFSPLWLILVGPTLLFAIWAQMKVKSAFAKYSQIGTSSGLSGAEAAAAVLQTQGIAVEIGASEGNPRNPNAVAIARTTGFLSDHYDPRSRVLRLSPNVYEGRSLASVGVACHEAGHALQHAHGYAPMAMRSNLVPVASFGSWAAFPIILLGLYFSHTLALLGILVFTAIVAFQIVTLPVEFNASSRAKRALYDMGIIRGTAEQQGVAAVLDAAALTYVAAAVSSVMTLLYYVLLVTGGGRRA